jgi:hypothetical protein
MRSVWLTVPILAAGAAFAQPSSGTAIAHTEGAVYLDGQRMPEGESPVPIPDHATIRTEAGHAEIQLSGGDTLFLGERSSVQVHTNRPFNFNRLEMLGGPAVIVTGKMGSMLDCEEPVRLSGGGIFRLDLRPLLGGNECAFKVYQGAAAVQMPSYIAVLTAGQSMGLDQRCGDMTSTGEFDVRKTDGLDQWSRQRTASSAGR